jgi:hypothetical protein
MVCCRVPGYSGICNESFCFTFEHELLSAVGHFVEASLCNTLAGQLRIALRQAALMSNVLLYTSARALNALGAGDECLQHVPAGAGMLLYVHGRSAAAGRCCACSNAAAEVTTAFSGSSELVMHPTWPTVVRLVGDVCSFVWVVT